MSTSEKITLKLTVGSTDFAVPLGLRIHFNGAVIYENAHVSSETEIQHDFSDDDGEHELAFEMFGKLPEHTKINEAGEILSDAMLSVTNLNMDEIDINHLFQQLATYTHDFNGSQSSADHKFYGFMGCNGAVKFKFTTPIYLWFLENM